MKNTELQALAEATLDLSNKEAHREITAHLASRRWGRGELRMVYRMVWFRRVGLRQDRAKQKKAEELAKKLAEWTPPQDSPLEGF